jgi:hypothetical protein
MSAISSAGGGNRAFASSAARGAGLVGAAVILGIILLQVIDNGPSGSDGGTVVPSVSTTTPTSTDGTTSTTAPAEARPRDQVRVVVLNGSGTSNAATLKSNNLLSQGYQVAPADDTQPRAGSIVTCQPGFESEAARLSKDAGPPDIPVDPAFPNPPPAGAENVNCIVILGSA